ELTRRTNGRVQVEIYQGGTLGKVTEMIDLVGGGAIDLGNCGHGYSFARLPMNAFFNAPMIYKNHEMAAKMSKLGYQTQKKVQEDMKKNNLHPFLFGALTEYRLISKKPIRTLADFKGLKVRTFGAVNPKMFIKLGAVPVNLSFTEAYGALQKGTLDCVYLSWTGSYVLKLFEVAKYVSDVNFGAINSHLSYVNLDLWNSWPQNLKALFNQISLEAEQITIKSVAEFDRKALEMMIAAGAELVHFREQEQLEKAVPDPINLVAERVASVGREYEVPARQYAEFLREALKK
ncbi:MAG: TRAP transporter substrate-binding protein DctP, partial [Desulfobacterales bacterium]|nr:TRAP transporter substrate-binding protein DctP [Desulfobacterales bacterium]